MDAADGSGQTRLTNNDADDSDLDWGTNTSSPPDGNGIDSSGTNPHRLLMAMALIFGEQIPHRLLMAMALILRVQIPHRLLMAMALILRVQIPHRLLMAMALILLALLLPN